MTAAAGPKLELNFGFFFKGAKLLTNLSSESDVKRLLRLWDPAFYFVDVLLFIKYIDVVHLELGSVSGDRLLPECFIQLGHGQKVWTTVASEE